MKPMLLFALFLALPLVSCGDFLNSKESKTEAPAQGPGQRQKNPFPPGYENPNAGAFSEDKMLVNTGVNVIAKNVRSFFLQAELLTDELSSYCAALETGSGIPAREISAKEQWKKTMLAFHRVDAVPLGPLTDNGRYLVDHIYAWPYLDRCGIDREVIRLAAQGSANPRLLYTSKGLGALEYLLFEQTLSSGCNGRAYPETVEWAQKPERQKKLERCRLALGLSRDLREKASELHFAWDPEEGNFSKTLIDGSRYPDLKEATNAFTDVLFAVERMKDQRMGRALGFHKDCTADEKKCPEMAEHELSGLALAAVQARVEGFYAAFFGSALPGERAFGLDDFLAERGHPEVAEHIRVNAERAIDEAARLSTGPSLQEKIVAMDQGLCATTTSTDRKVPVCALFQDLRAVASTMKIEVLTVLSLRSPPGFEGDND